jgi:hypothetical protein
MKRFVALFSVCGVLTLIAGCSDAPELVQIEGRVTRGGKPVPGILVQFHPQDGRPSWGKSDPEGKFELNYSKHYEGARLGKHRIFVTYDNTPETPYDESGRQKLNSEQREVIKKYGNLETTPLEVDLKEDGQVVEIKLD